MNLAGRFALLLAVAVAGGVVADRVTSNPKPQRAALAAVPQPIPGVFLPAPAAAYVRLMPGCVWGTGKTALSVTRKVGQFLNVANLGTAAHRFAAANTFAAAAPLPSWRLPSHTAVAAVWKLPGTVRLSTCSGGTTLTVVVALPLG